MKKLLTTLLLLCCLLSVKAQYVTIPDSNFVKFLTLKYPACMSGNQMDTTCNGVVNALGMVCTHYNISSLSGLEYFDNLTNFQCPDNNITALPRLPKKLEILTCSSNKLTNLPVLPATLTSLACGDNLLTSLPVLPAKLNTLVCPYNNLTALPALPSGLLYLWCNSNKLTALPALPTAFFQDLLCNDNLLTALPALPNSLISLRCHNNKLTSLPALPTLKFATLVCYNNKLTSLPALPATLKQLEYYLNQVSTVPALPAGLEFLNCSDNGITTLPVLPGGLTYFYCNNNNIKVIGALPATIDRFSAFNNQLTSIGALPDSLTELKLNDNVNLSCFPVLLKFKGPAPLFDISNTAITCLPNVIQHAGSIPAIDTMPICGPCAAPVFTFGKITSSTATILWSKIDCITNYRLAYRVKGATAWTAIVAGAAAASRVLSGLASGTQYEIRMRTGCTASTLSVWSAIQTFKTDVVCVAPSGITVTTIKKDRATLNWTAIAGVYSYKIRYRVQGTSVWSNQAAIAPVVHKVLTGLAANTTYEYQMLTVCDTTGAQASTWTATATFKTTLRMEDGGEAATFVIYPNPVTGELRVSNVDLRMGDELVVSDVMGRTLITQSATSKTINVSGLATGVYFVTLRSGDGNVTRKFVKE